MFRLVTMEDYVRITPDRFRESLENVVRELVRSKYEGRIVRDLGIIVAVVNIRVSKVGKVVPTDGATYHKVVFDALVYYPLLQEVVEGEVTGVVRYGAFVRIGPIEALLHISQITDEKLRLDATSQMLISERPRGEKVFKLAKGDIVRARIVSISYPTPGSRREGEATLRVGLTMRQPWLGPLHVIEEELKKLARKSTS